MQYIAVTATRNEAELEKHVESVLNQSIRPAAYIIVDDMSDPPVYPITGTITIRSNQPRHKTRGLNQSKALNIGVTRGTQLYPGWGFLLKTDVDTILPHDYAEQMIRYLHANPLSGLSSGWSNTMGYSQQPHRPSDAAKVFTRQCWDDIDGYTETNAFDTHATLKAVQRGYMPRINHDVNFYETRPNKKQNLDRWIESGKTRKTWGFPLWHTCLAACKNMFNGKPFIIGPLAMIYSHATHHTEETLLPQEWVNNYARWELENILKR